MRENWDEFVKRVRELPETDRKREIDLVINKFMEEWKTLKTIYTQRLLSEEVIEGKKTEHFDEYRTKLLGAFGYAGVL